MIHTLGKKITNFIDYHNGTINQLDEIYIYKILYIMSQYFILCLSLHGTFNKKEHSLGYKVML